MQFGYGDSDTLETELDEFFGLNDRPLLLECRDLFAQHLQHCTYTEGTSIRKLHSYRAMDEAGQASAGG